MHQLVFVHGVNNRAGPEYYAELANRDELFKKIVWSGSSVNIRNPYWGGNAATFSRNLACLPSRGAKAATFGLAGGAPAGSSGTTQPLAEVAASDFGAAVDAIFVAMVEKAEADNVVLSDEQIGQFAAAGAYAEDNALRTPSWAAANTLDAVVVSELRKRLPEPAAESFGIWDALSGAAAAVADRARNFVSSGVAPLIRDELSPRFAIFLGDIFVYLYGATDHPKRLSIRGVVADDLNAAWTEAKRTGGKLVVIGHSMGGVILYDMLREPAPELNSELKIDLLVTVGSQPGLFGEMDLLGPPTDGDAKAPHPASVTHWWNVFDPVDLLSFRCEPVFEGVTDFEFGSATGMVDAHTTYFKRPRFHVRLRKRLVEIGVLA